MLVHAVNIGDRRKFEYFQLPESSRRAARDAVLDQELKAISRSCEGVRTQAVRNIHVLVNNPHHVASILWHKRHVRRLLSDLSHFEKFIDSNLCHFLEDGSYITYFPPR